MDSSRTSLRPNRPVASEVSEVKVKGQAFLSTLLAFGEMRGDPFREELVRRMSGEGGDALRGGFLLAANFYPVAWYRELFRAACELAPGVPELARAAGRVSGERDLKGIYRVMIRLLSTETMLRQSTRLLGLVYQGGGAEVLEARPGFARVRYFGFHGFDRNVWQDALGGAEAMCLATGAKKLALRVEAGGGNGDPEMIASVHWS